MSWNVRWTTAATVAAATAALALAVGHQGCVPAPEQDVATWPTRDVLGLSPALVADLDGHTRADLEGRLTEAALDQAEEAATIVAPAPGGAERPLGHTLMDVDEALEAAGQRPLLIQTIDPRPDGPLAHPCPLTAADLTGPIGPGEADAVQWVIDPAFDDQPLGGGSERDALERRLPRLARWWSRCAAPTHQEVQPGGGRASEASARVDLIRADGAPALFATFPGRQAIYLNPLALVLFSPDRALPSPGFRTTTAALTADEINACTSELDVFCNSCNTPEKVQQARLNDPNACSRQLFVTGEVWENCEDLRFRVPNGLYRYCLNTFMGQLTTGNGGPTVNVNACMAGKIDPSSGRDLDTVCDPRFVGTAAELTDAYEGFSGATADLCQREFINCAPKAATPTLDNITEAPEPGCGDACSEEGTSGCSCENAFGLDSTCDEDGGE